MFPDKKTAMLHLDLNLFNRSTVTLKNKELEKLFDDAFKLETDCMNKRIYFFSQMLHSNEEYTLEYELWELRQRTFEN